MHMNIKRAAKQRPTRVSYAQEYEEAGTDLAQALTKKDKIVRQKAAMPPNIAKALARLSSGLYIVTAATSGAKGGWLFLRVAWLHKHCASVTCMCQR